VVNITISTQTRYAVRFLLELSYSEEADKPITLRQAADAQGISVAYLESIALKLRKSGYLKSYKGAGGGYTLAVPIGDITLGEIMRLMENKYFQIHCAEDSEETCKHFDDCRIAEAWGALEAHLTSVVDGVRLSQLSNKVC
jgi:Rrf2 family protein